MSSLAGFFIGIRLAFRVRYFWLVGACLLIVGISASLASMFSGRQPATVALDVGLSVARLILPLVLVLMTQELISREFDRRYFLSSLTYPKPRRNLLLSRYLAVVFLVSVLLVAVAILLGIIVWLIAQGYEQATPVDLGGKFMLTIAFLGVDLLVLASMASFLAVVSSTPSFVLIGTFGFMLVARSYASIISLLVRESWVVESSGSYRAGIGYLAYALPDLGALDVRMITLYGKMEFFPANWPLLLISSFVYVFALLALAIWALQRKRFS